MSATSRGAPKIIFVPFIDGFGGVERLVLTLSRYLNQKGVAHTLLCHRDTIGLGRYADWPLDVIQLRPGRHPVAESWKLRRWMQRRGAGPTAEPFLVFDLKGAFYAAGAKAPYVLHLTDPPSLLPADMSKHAPSLSGHSALRSLSGPRTWLRLGRAELVHRVNSRGVRRAKRVIAMTEKIAREIEELYSTRALVLRPGIQRAASRKAEIRGKPVRFLSVSRLEESKHIAWIVRALKALEEGERPLHSRFDWSLDIVGEGPAAASLAALSQSLGLSDRVTFHGRVPDRELEDLYAAASIFLMPAVQGYGLPALEALARRVPVILHRSSGVSEILSGSPWVEIIDAADGEDLGPAIVTMLESISRSRLHAGELPSFPTDMEWAEEICRACQWRSIT